MTLTNHILLNEFVFISFKRLTINFDLNTYNIVIHSLTYSLTQITLYSSSINQGWTGGGAAPVGILHFNLIFVGWPQHREYIIGLNDMISKVERCRNGCFIDGRGIPCLLKTQHWLAGWPQHSAFIPFHTNPWMPLCKYSQQRHPCKCNSITSGIHQPLHYINTHLIQTFRRE